MRKSILLSIFAVGLLLAGTVIAQLPQHNTTFGTVLSYTPGERLVIETDDGQKAFMILAGTTLPDESKINVGDAIVVDWNVAQSADALPEVRTIRLDRANTMRADTMETDDMDARAEAEMDAEVETTTTTRSRTDTTRTSASATMEQDDQDFDSNRTRTASADTNDRNTRSSLPQTGSNLPLAGLIGLLAMAGAATLTLRR